MSQFSIGIDLGTTNCALAFTPLGEGSAKSRTLPISQWDSASTLVESDTLPSFLFLPNEAEQSELRGKAKGGNWIVGRFAKNQTTSAPLRVVHSAKSWLSTSGVDRESDFLPWSSDQVPADEKISPVRSSALLLNYLRDVWNDAHPEAPFEQQDITVTVPASFDAVAQRLTLNAAESAGFPKTMRLLEEPQAAFYNWLEVHEEGGTLQSILPELPDRPHTILVVDVGGGTTDFSLFDIRLWKNRKLPVIKRITVSNHILLGGDNIDLAIAHAAETQLGESLNPDQWGHLVAQSRRLKEEILSQSAKEIHDADPSFSVSVPGRGSGLLAGTLTAKLERKDIESILFEGFYPECAATDQPERSSTGLREFGLPYATDSAITRHLAEFLQGQPLVDGILFNGGSLKPSALRERITLQIANWQDGASPTVLNNQEPDLAVALGAASYGFLLKHHHARIEAGAARSIYLEVQRGDEASLVCVLPKGTPQEKEIILDDLSLSLIVNQPVQFRAFSSVARSKEKAGDLVHSSTKKFHTLPSLQTIASADVEEQIPVFLSSKLNAIGVVQIELVAKNAPETRWPLQFNLRENSSTATGANTGTAPPLSNIDPEALEAARDRITYLFGHPYSKKDKLTPNRLTASLETILELPKSEWNAPLLRELWTTHTDCFDWRYQSVEHEESWITFAGFLLRPGYGVVFDETRIDQLWRLQEEDLWFPGKRIEQQYYILWRRISGGLNRDRQEILIQESLPILKRQSKPSAELVRLLGSLERASIETKTEICELLIAKGRDLGASGGYAEPYWVALTLLLNRAPTYGGPETALPPDVVGQAFDSLREFDWKSPAFAALAPAFLRAARRIDNRALDLPKPIQKEILQKLKACDVSPVKLAPLENYVPIEASEQASLFGEALPPGLVLG
tara:strand:+ start:1712 stop:4444 length:2733 start_codon:yes stop_codon:yes gene_type:complete